MLDNQMATFSRHSGCVEEHSVAHHFCSFLCCGRPTGHCFEMDWRPIAFKIPYRDFSPQRLTKPSILECDDLSFEKYAPAIFEGKLRHLAPSSEVMVEPHWRPSCSANVLRCAIYRMGSSLLTAAIEDWPDFGFASSIAPFLFALNIT